jgi:hypothetical protein
VYKSYLPVPSTHCIPAEFRVKSDSTRCDFQMKPTMSSSPFPSSVMVPSVVTAEPFALGVGFVLVLLLPLPFVP